MGYLIVILLSFGAGYGFGWAKGVTMNRIGLR